MCGRIFCLFPDKEALVNCVSNEILSSTSINFSIKDQIQNYTEPRYNIAPSAHIPVLVATGENKNLCFKQLHWGFSRGNTKALHVNARCEEIYEKVTFKHLIDTERCVIVCSGYYEWKISAYDKSQKFPYSFRLKNKDVCFIAALRDPKTDSVVLITRSATSKIESIHSRMPLILKDNTSLQKWLDLAIPFSKLIEELVSKEDYNSSTDTEIECTPLGPTVNNAKNVTKDCLQSLQEYKESSFRRGIGKYFTKKPKIQ